MSKEKKKFGETGLGSFLKKAVEKLPHLAGVALDAVANPSQAVSIVRNALSGQDSTSPEVEKLQMEFMARELEFDSEMASLEQKDKENARELQKAALKSEKWLPQHFLYLLSGVVVVGAFVFGFALMFKTVPEENKRLVEMFADVFVFGGAIMVLQFFLGGSFRNRNKQNVE
jgi:hypothetical protein